MKDFSNWIEFEGASEGSGRSEKVWLINPEDKQTGLFKFKKDKVKDAMEDGFTPLVGFTKLDKKYTNDMLFPAFSSRLPDRKRKDIDQILKKYGLLEYDAYTLLKRSWARLPIDNLEFIDPISDLEDRFERTFYMAGVRHYIGCEGKEREQAIKVAENDKLQMKTEPDNKVDEFAIALYNSENQKLGYIPRYYSRGITELINQGRKMECKVKSVDKSKSCRECIDLILEVE